MFATGDAVKYCCVLRIPEMIQHAKNISSIELTEKAENDEILKAFGKYQNVVNAMILSVLMKKTQKTYCVPFNG